jgi:exodeoxyribonuclease VII small subunit
MKKIAFEAAMKQLEKIVREMESGDLPLEDALKKFEEGVALSRALNERLDEVETRVTRLVQGADGKPESQAFEPPTDSQEKNA